MLLAIEAGNIRRNRIQKLLQLISGRIVCYILEVFRIGMNLKYAHSFLYAPFNKRLLVVTEGDATSFINQLPKTVKSLRRHIAALISQPRPLQSL